jgi:hypothetical protein
MRSQPGRDPTYGQGEWEVADGGRAESDGARVVLGNHYIGHGKICWGYVEGERQGVAARSQPYAHAVEETGRRTDQAR